MIDTLKQILNRPGIFTCNNWSPVNDILSEIVTAGYTIECMKSGYYNTTLRNPLGLGKEWSFWVYKDGNYFAITIIASFVNNESHYNLLTKI